jgi:hypothetical protein
MRVREKDVEHLLLAYGAKEMEWDRADVRPGEGARCCKFKLVMGAEEYQGWIRWQFVERHTFLMQLAFEVQALSMGEWEFLVEAAAYGAFGGVEHFQYLSETCAIVWMRTEDASRGPLHRVLYRLFSKASEEVLGFKSIVTASDLGTQGVRNGEDVTSRLLSPAEGYC